MVKERDNALCEYWHVWQRAVSSQDDALEGANIWQRSVHTSFSVDSSASKAVAQERKLMLRTLHLVVVVAMMDVVCHQFLQELLGGNGTLLMVVVQLHPGSHQVLLNPW